VCYSQADLAIGQKALTQIGNLKKDNHNWEEQVPEQKMHRIPGLQDKQQFICTVGLPSVVIPLGYYAKKDTKRRNSPAGSFPHQ
jgi:hypothetical protein